LVQIHNQYYINQYFSYNHAMIQLNTKAPDFSVMAFHENDFHRMTLESVKGKWAVLFFYPADFTFVCPTELEDMAEHYDDFKKLGVEVLSVSTDTHFVHKAWHDTSEAINKIRFPMLADPEHTLSTAYQVLRHEGGVADRATFVIDPDGMIKSIEVSDEPVGRHAKELLRKVLALQHARENPGIACPAKWAPGQQTLTPGIDLVGKL